MEMTQVQRLTKMFQELDRVTPRPLDHEDYAIAAVQFFKNEPQIEEIFVSSSCPEDIYAAFTDKARAQWDAKESGTELCSIKLHRGPKAMFQDNEKD